MKYLKLVSVILLVLLWTAGSYADDPLRPNYYSTSPEDSRNAIKIGDGANTLDKYYYVNTGETNLPAIRYDVSGDAWQLSNDGTTFSDIPSAAASGDMTKAVYDSDDDGIFSPENGGLGYDTSGWTGIAKVISGVYTTVASIDIADLATSPKVVAMSYEINGGGSAIATGAYGGFDAQFGFTITSVTISADQSASAAVDIWVDALADGVPTDDDSITSVTPPTLVTATYSTDVTLDSWTTTIAADDQVRFNVDSNDTAEILRVTIKGTRS